ncbi:hypothetical protein [Polymorphospora rubra]|uniref:Lipoprotein n=1 Tax=Polymorphospora rubra TaxID=338584 RepID=A0A810N0T5_9ACTN|nr:hypothetical protein [Polymorphospora rubra]BCJ67191.1 hypothetical protein Prubr_42120 [Polymorphospora rubra]
MISVRRGLLGIGLAAAIVGGVAACGGTGEVPPEQALPVGHYTLDGQLQVWPARGGLSGDGAAHRAVADAVDAWRTPAGDRPRLETSGILWLGEIDGRTLAVVAADVPVYGASWLLQLDGTGDGLTVTNAAQYTDPGYLVYSDLLPVRLDDTTRYLTSARVEQVTGPNGRPLRVSDGLTDPVGVQRCTATPVAVRLRATESLPRGTANDELLDLGSAVEPPRYPVVPDRDGRGATALEDLDTCALAGEDIAFGSIDPNPADGRSYPRVPASWPIESIYQVNLGEVESGPLAGRFDRLTWRSQEGTTYAAVFRPENGTPAVSKADTVAAVQAYEIEIQGQTYVVLSWNDEDDDAVLQLPDGVRPVLEQRGLAVVPKADRRQTFRVSVDGRLETRTVEK